jgi:hypothetical protein
MELDRGRSDLISTTDAKKKLTDSGLDDRMICYKADIKEVNR